MSNFKVNKLITTFIVVLMLVSMSIFFVPNKTASALDLKHYIYQNAWHLGEKGLKVSSLYNDILLKTGKDVLKGKSDVVVAVIDSGVDKTNPFFDENTFWVNADEVVGNGIDDDNNGVIDDINGASFNGTKINNNFADCMNDGNGGKDWHGTHIAGIIHSIAPNVRIMPIRAGRNQNNGKGSAFFEEDVIRAILYAADNGASVINLSFGTTAKSFITSKEKIEHNGSEKEMTVADAINYAVNEKNVLVVAASGNDNQNTNFYPASLSNVLSVMASDIEGKRWQATTQIGSNYGEQFDVMAPGYNILSTYGKGVIGRDVKFGEELISPQKNFGFKSGTSMASPYVAGVSALLLSVTNFESPILIKKYMTSQQLLSKSNATEPELVNKNLLLDYSAVINILDKIIIDQAGGNEDLVSNSLKIFDNEKLTFKPTTDYEGSIKWYVNGKPMGDGMLLTISPKENTIVELKVGGEVAERYVVIVKSFDDYLTVILCSIFGTVLAVILIAIAIYFIVKNNRKKKENESISEQSIGEN